MADENVRKIVRATKEITVIIHGEEYEALLIPKKNLVEVDFTQCPEDDPLRRERNVEVLTEIDLDMDDVMLDPNAKPGTQAFKLTPAGAKRLLESL